MRKKSASRPSILLGLTLLLAAVKSATCVGQQPVQKAGADAFPAGSILQQGSPLGPLPPSTVSPAIERFVKASGRDVPPIPTSPSALPGPMNVTRGSPSMPSNLRPSSPPQGPQSEVPGDRKARDLPPTLPGSMAAPAREPGNPETVGPNPLATGMTLKPAPFEPTDRRFPLNLATALRLSDARPLIVAAAQASVWVSEADLTRAKVLWVPTLAFGFDYIRHDGGGPDFNKGIMTAPSVNFFYGGGGLYQFVNLTDAIFEPMVARHVVNSRHYEVQSAKNDALLRAADAYFLVHQYRGMYAGALYTVELGHDLVEKVVELSRDLVPKDEVDRARNILAELEQRAVSARQEWRVQSANLTQLLRLDPRAVIEPLESDHAQVTLIDPGRPLDDLMPIALANRPELASRRAILQAAEVRVRREKNRPLLPIVMVNGFQSPNELIQAGIFGLGPNSSLNQWRGRDDISLQLVWQLENFGIGNLAKVKAQRGQESRAIIDLRRVQDMVASDVTRANARVQSAAARVLQADRALRTGIITFNGHLEGLGQTRRFGDVLVLTFRPQEAVYSLEQLNTSFVEYFTTVAEYNRAQFELFHALGYPARELAQLRLPGQAIPVDTSRPSFLPPVGDGPPPATR